MIIKKKHLKGALTELLCIFLALLALVYLLYHALSGYSLKVESRAAVYSAEPIYMELEGVIFRDETLLYTSYPDNVVHLADDGVRLAIGDPAYGISPIALSADTAAKISSLSHKIRLTEEALSAPTATTNYEILDSEITSLLASAYFSDYSETVGSPIYDRLTVALIRASLKDSKSEVEASLSAMKREYDSLLSSVSFVEEVTFDRPVYYYRGCDGGEEIFTSGALENITPDSLKEMKIRYSVAIPSYTAVATTTDTHRWNLAVTLTGEQATWLRVGGSYNIEFPLSELVLEGKVEYLSADADLRVAVFSFSGLPLGFDRSRIQSVRLQYDTVEGYRIPSSTLRYIEGRSCVYTVYGGQIFLRTAEPVARRGDYYYISPDTEPMTLPDGEVIYGLKENDFVVTRGKELYHLKIVE